MSRANYDLPDDVLEQAKKLSGATSKKQAIVIALNEYVKRKQVEELVQMRGRVRLNWTQASLRKYRG